MKNKKKSNKNIKKRNIFYMSSIVLSVVNAICNIVSMFKGNTKNYLFNLYIGDVCVTVASTVFILLVAAILILYVFYRKKEYIVLSTILYLIVMLLQIPVFEFKYTLLISIGILLLLIIGLIKERK